GRTRRGTRERSGAERERQFHARALRPRARFAPHRQPAESGRGPALVWVGRIERIARAPREGARGQSGQASRALARRERRAGRWYHPRRPHPRPAPRQPVPQPDPAELAPSLDPTRLTAAKSGGSTEGAAWRLVAPSAQRSLAVTRPGLRWKVPLVGSGA